MNYPEKFIRGVVNPEHVDAAGRASAEIFQFNANERGDGFYESSINWYDTEDALTLVMEQRKKDGQTYQFHYGAAVINRSEADRIIKNKNYESAFRYERAPIEGNEFHGNLLRNDLSLTKQIRLMIAGSLAMYADVIPRKSS